MSYHARNGRRCHECKSCFSFDDVFTHPKHFEIESLSQHDGIDFQDDIYTAKQIADAFVHYITGHMNVEMKKSALKEWHRLLPILLDGPLEFDLLPVFQTLDDLLFLGALKESCKVGWADRLSAHTEGACTPRVMIRGPRISIELLKPECRTDSSVQESLNILLHEMCHAIFKFACTCAACQCKLNEMNEEGLTGHGPCFQSVSLAVEETINSNLPNMEGSVELFDVSAELEQEVPAKRKMLRGLYEKIKREDDPAERLKGIERRKRKEDMENPNSSGGELREREETEALEYAGMMFAEVEEKASLSYLGLALRYFAGKAA